ncbi:MAG: pilus assembly protein N-terminal domain-containing protein [Planctomycetaceae bacterium]|nr:pilus assembly protein N-terminal domain-containing protein [Planctomycetaceae bacterium]
MLILFGLSASVLQAQQPYSARPSRGPAQPGPIVQASAVGSRSQDHVVPAQFQTPQVGVPDRRIHLVPKAEQELDVIQHRSQLIHTSARVRRIHIADPSVLEVIQFSEYEFSLLGVAIGTTDLTFWFEGSAEPLLYVAHVIRDPSLDDQRRLDYGKIERKLALLYPNSKVYLIPMSRKIIVRGQAKDAEEAARIMQIVRGEVLAQDGALFAGYAGNGNVPIEPTGGRGGFGNGYGGAGGYGVDLLSSFVVNELQVPGEFQVMLRVRIAELNRSQLRRLGIDWAVIWNDARHVVAQTFAATAPILTGLFENGEIAVLLDALASNGSAKIMEDSVVITMSGNPASFLSGGEFAVPNTIGNNGVLVGTTTFRGFGSSIIATPTVVDDDLIRLQVIPELSAINSANSVGGIPGVDVRRVQMTVELREGQTIVLGGLFARRQQSEVTRIPLLSEIPLVGRHLFSTRQATEDETEMLIVVTPEIVRPMDPEEVPPMPGFYVTHPDDIDFCKLNRTEGTPDLGHYRLLPYGNGNGYGENVGFGYHNPDYGSYRNYPPTFDSGAGYAPMSSPPPGQQHESIPRGPGPAQENYVPQAPPLPQSEFYQNLPTPLPNSAGRGESPTSSLRPYPAAMQMPAPAPPPPTSPGAYR